MGTALITCSSILYCVMYLKAQSARLRELELICSMLEMTGAELAARLTPLPELAELLEGRMAEPAKSFYSKLKGGMAALGERSFYSIWSLCVSESFKRLSADELQMLTELGGSLGRYDIDRQLKAIDVCTEVFRTSVERSAREQPDRKKLHIGLALSTAAMLVVILL